MKPDNIEIHIIHNPTINPEDNSFGIAITINDEDVCPLELN